MINYYIYYGFQIINDISNVAWNRPTNMAKSTEKGSNKH